jgi:hypothetical protein
MVPVEYIIRAETWPVNAQLHCSNYKWQLHVSATNQPSSGSSYEKQTGKSSTYCLHIIKNNKWKIYEPYI